MWHDIEQNNDIWLDLRIGKVTGSSIGSVMANYGKAFGEPAKKLAINISVERITNKRVQKGTYKNDHMERGHDEEPIARARYEELYFIDVGNGGFFDNGKTGCSPDGRIGEKGLIEIKSVIPTTHYANIKRMTFDPSYKWQYIFNIRESNADWLDFVSYCSGYPKHSNLYVYRIEKEDILNELSQIKIRLAEFEEMVNKISEDINKHIA